MNNYEKIDKNIEKLSEFRQELLENLIDKLDNSLHVGKIFEVEYNSLSQRDKEYKEILDMLSDKLMRSNRIKMIHYFANDAPSIAMNYFMENIKLQNIKLKEPSD